MNKKIASYPSKSYWQKALHWFVQYIRQKGTLSFLALTFNSVREWVWFAHHRNSSVNLMDLDIIENNLQNKSQATCYAPTPITPFLKMIKSLKLPEKPVFIDYGAGKARVMLLAGETKRFHKIKGLEFSQSIYQIGQKNIQSYIEKTGEKGFELIHTDVVQYQVQEEDNIFYFFNPFNENILKACLNNIFSSLKAKPRSALLIYHSNYQDYTSHITKEGLFQPLKTFSALGSYFYVYKYSPHSEKEQVLLSKAQQ